MKGSSSTELPYKFNGKELDSDTGLYYYGARYMNSITSLWYGVDPLAEKYPNVGAFVYCHCNPIKLIDPNGCYDIENVDKKNTDNNKNITVVAIFPSYYNRDNAIDYDYQGALKSNVCVVTVRSIKDCKKALKKLENLKVLPTHVTFNSHGTGGEYYTEEGKIPAAFRIGRNQVDSFTDLKGLENCSILHNAEIFIGACNVGSTNSGIDFTITLSKKFNTTVITSCHVVEAGYKYDGGMQLNVEGSYYQKEGKGNLFVKASYGIDYELIRDYTINKFIRPEIIEEDE